MTSNAIVFVTGANRGLGYELVKSLVKSSNQKYTVLLGSRDFANGEKAAESIKSTDSSGEANVIPIQIDITDQESVKAAVERIQKEFGRIDVLVNNAGGTFDFGIATGQYTSKQGWDISMNNNAISTHLFTEAFAPLLVNSSSSSPIGRRLIFVSSTVSSFEYTFIPGTMMPINVSPSAGWPKSGGFPIPAYRASKAAENMVAREWFRTLAEDGVKGHIVCPGAIDTGFWDQTKESLGGKAPVPLNDPSIAAGFIKEVVEGKWDEHVGKFINSAGIVPW